MMTTMEHCLPFTSTGTAEKEAVHYSSTMATIHKVIAVRLHTMMMLWPYPTLCAHKKQLFQWSY